jgi:hypothetical protein
MLTLLLLLTAQTPATDEVTKLLPAINSGIETYVKEARKHSGTLMIHDVTEAKKAVRGFAVKSDWPRYLGQTLNAEQKPTQVELYRSFGDIRQAVSLQRNRSGAMMMQDEKFRKKGEPGFDIEDVRVFAFDSPTCLALRPLLDLKLTVPDMLEYNPIEVTKVENLTIDNTKVIKLTYQVSKAKNEALDTNARLNPLLAGWVMLRPDHLFTVLKAEYTLPGERRRPARTWKTDYVYEPGTGPFQMLKEIKLETIDQAADKPDLKLIKQLYEFNFKPNKEPLTDKDFTMAQFGVKERTANDWLTEVAAREKAEAEEQAKIAALPPGALKPVSAGINVSPWAILVGGFAAFIILVMWVFWSTSRPSRAVTPPASNPAPTNQA